METEKHDDRRDSQAGSKPKQPRFKVEKLEERIAPHHRVGHYPPGHSGYYEYGPPGHQSCHPKPPCNI